MNFLIMGLITMAIVTAILNLIAGPQPGDLGYKGKGQEKKQDSEEKKE